MTRPISIAMLVLLLGNSAWAAGPAAPPAPAPAKTLDRLQQLAKCNPFRAIGAAAKAAPGETAADGTPGQGAKEPGDKAGSADRPPAADTLAALKKSLVVTAIVSTDETTYAVIDGKKYLAGDEVAPRVRILRITPTGITLAPVEAPDSP